MRGILTLTLAFSTLGVLLAISVGAEAATSVPGQTLSANATWTLAGSPYVVTGPVTVAGSPVPTLTVEPGVEVQFTSTGSLTVGNGWQPGRLVANGTAADPARFVSAAASPAPGDWTGLRLQGPASGVSYLSHALVEHAGRSSRSSVEVVGHAASLDNVTIRDGAWAGAYVSGASPTLGNVTIQGHARWGLYAEANALPTLAGVTLADNGDAPLRVRLDQDLGNVTLLGHAVRRVELHGVDLTASRTLRIPPDAATGEPHDPLLLSGFMVRNGAAWTLEPGTRLLVEPWVQVHVGTHAQKGSLRAEGTEAAPIVLQARSAPDGWYGLYFRGDSAPLGESVLRNVTVAHSRDDGIEAYHYSGLVLDNVTLSHNARHGLRLDASNPAMRHVQALDSGREGVVLVFSSPTWEGGLVARSGATGVHSSGCGLATLRGVAIQDPGAYGYFSDNPCGGAHLDGVTIEDAAGRAWRNRIDARESVTVVNASVPQVEYWGVTLTADRTLSPVVDAATGATLTPVVVSGFEVRNGATLTLPANTTVLFGEHVWLHVGTHAQKGTLKAEGTAAEPIRLLARSGTAANGWNGLYFRGDAAPAGGSVLRNVTVAHSRDDGIETYHYGGLVLENVTLEDHARYGLRLDGPSPALRDLQVRRAGWEGVFWTWSSPLLERALVEDTGRSGVYSSGCGVGTLRDVTIRNPRGYGFFADGACNGAHLDGVTIEDAAGRPWRNRIDAREDVTVVNATVPEVEYWGATLTADRTLARVVDEATGAAFVPVVLSGFEVRNGATLTIPANTTLLAEDWVWINVGTYAQKATLKAEGTLEEPIVLRSRSGSIANGWYGLYFRGDSAPAGESVLRNVTVAHSRDDGIEGYHYRNLLLDNVTLEGHGRHGIRYDGGAPQLRNVHVVGGGADGAHFLWSGAAWRGGSIDRPAGNGVSTSGCGVVVLQDLVVRSPVGYGFFADGACNGAHLDGVRFEDVTRPWRNRLDARADAVVAGSLVDEVEHWGVDVVANRTLPAVVDEQDGRRLADVILSGFEVRNGATLTLHAGTRLLVEQWAWINVGTYAQAGSLRAEGTAAEPVVIAGRSGVSTNGWYGLYFRGDSAPVSGTVLRNVTVAHSRDHGLDMYHYRGFELDNVTVERNAGDGVHAYGAAPGPARVRSSTLQRNGGDGLFVEHGSVTVLSSNLSRNSGNGFEMRYGTSARLEDSTLFDNVRSGVNVTAGSPVLTMRRNHFWQNAGLGVDMGGSSGSLIVDNAFAQNREGQARASGLHTWNLTRTEGTNFADGPFLGGNVWSDYGGIDADGDGLGDTLLPYAKRIGPGADWHPVIGDLYADFRVSIPDIAGAPQELRFEDATLGGLARPTRWHWSFGDGGEATGREALHLFPADGTYDVTLTVWNDRGQTASVTKGVVVDSEAPYSVANLTGTEGLDGWYASAVRVELSGVDQGGGVSAIRWRLGEGAFTNYLEPFLVWDEGDLVLEHYAIDASGNVGPTLATSFRVDRLAPDVQLDVLNGTRGRGAWYVSDVLAALNASGGPSGLASLQYAFDAEPNLTYEGPLSVTRDGEHALRYRAADGAGNVAEGVFLVLRDTAPPEVRGNESGLVGGSGWYVGRATVNLTGDDDASGLLHLNASIDGGPWFEVTGPFDIEGDGPHTLNVTATDAAGNVLDVPARTVRVEAAGEPVASARVDVALAADGWHRAQADLRAGDQWVPLPALEGKPDPAPDAPLPELPSPEDAPAQEEPALLQAFLAWLLALDLSA